MNTVPDLKYSTYIPEDQKVVSNIHILQARNSYKFLETLNSAERLDTTKSIYEDVKEPKSQTERGSMIML